MFQMLKKDKNKFTRQGTNMRIQQRTNPAITTSRLEFAWECLKMAKWLMNQSEIMTNKANGDFNGIFSLLKEYVNNEEQCQ